LLYKVIRRIVCSDIVVVILVLVIGHSPSPYQLVDCASLISKWGFGMALTPGIIVAPLGQSF